MPISKVLQRTCSCCSAWCDLRPHLCSADGDADRGSIELPMLALSTGWSELNPVSIPMSCSKQPNTGEQLILYFYALHCRGTAVFARCCVRAGGLHVLVESSVVRPPQLCWHWATGHTASAAMTTSIAMHMHMQAWRHAGKGLTEAIALSGLSLRRTMPECALAYQACLFGAPCRHVHMVSSQPSGCA